MTELLRARKVADIALWTLAPPGSVARWPTLCATAFLAAAIGAAAAGETTEKQGRLPQPAADPTAEISPDVTGSIRPAGVETRIDEAFKTASRPGPVPQLRQALQSAISEGRLPLGSADASRAAGPVLPDDRHDLPSQPGEAEVATTTPVPPPPSAASNEPIQPPEAPQTLSDAVRDEPDLDDSYLTALAPFEEAPVFPAMEADPGAGFLIPLPEQPGLIPTPSPRPSPPEAAAVARPRPEPPAARPQRQQRPARNSATARPSAPRASTSAPRASAPAPQNRQLPPSLLPTRPPAD